MPIVDSSPGSNGDAPAGRPRKFCDLVMKGGVTSGIVYPKAVAVLKDAYTFKNIGGTSAGAMAAAATAAAEYGRQHGYDGGFEEVAGLAEWLSGQDEGNAHTRLFNLFQPGPKTRPIYQVLIAIIGPRQGRWGRVAFTAIRSFWIAALVGALPGLVLAALSLAGAGGGTRVGLLAFAASLVVTGMIVGVILGITLRVRRELPAAGFGLCPGCTDPKPGQPLALTNWLTGYLNRVAGKPESGPPLTFGDLWGTHDPKAPHAINLEMMTTNLTHGRPYRLPALQGGFYFNPDEMRTYFPEGVVRWMIDHPRAPSKGPDLADPDRYAPLRPLPDPADLPVVVAARMSLSLPILIGAVPLYAIDRSRLHYLDDEAKKRLQPERCWFSDGGICSNFPVHFFDGHLPRWPTFGIDLKDFDLDDTKHENDVWMPEKNGEGITAIWTRFDRGGGLTSVLGFVKAIVDAARNWSDSTLLQLPGYRDRIVHVSLDEATEGGMNLDMTGPVILALAGRGEKAGRMLVERFVHPTANDVLTWDNHRWVRFRSLMALFEDMIEQIDGALAHPEPGDRTYAELAARGPDDPPGGYRLREPQQREFAKQQLDRFSRLIEEWMAEDTKELQFRQGDVPHPRPTLRTAPNL